MEATRLWLNLSLLKTSGDCLRKNYDEEHLLLLPQKLLHFPQLSCARHNLNSWLTILHQKHVHKLHSHKAPYQDLYHDSPTTGISKMTADPLEPGIDDTWLLNLP